MSAGLSVLTTHNFSKMFLRARRVLEFSHGLDPKRTCGEPLYSIIAPLFIGQTRQLGCGVSLGHAAQRFQEGYQVAPLLFSQLHRHHHGRSAWTVEAALFVMSHDLVEVR